MDSNQLPDNNYSPAPMPNNEYPNNGYQNNTYPNNVNPNNGYPNNGYENNEYQNNVYPNNGYQNNNYPNNVNLNNGYPNNGYENNEYQNNVYPNNGYQNNNYPNNVNLNNGYPNNGYENNEYQNNVYPNNGYQNNNYPNNVNLNNGYQPNVYQNNQQPVNNYPANAYPNATNTSAHKSKYTWLIVVIVVAIVAVGGYVISKPHYNSTNLKPHYNCSAPKSANIEEYVHCHSEEAKKLTNGFNDATSSSPFNITFATKGDQLNINAKFKKHLSDLEITALKTGMQTYGDSLSNLMPQSASDEMKEKIIAPVRIHFSFSNDDGTFIADKEFSFNN